MPIFDNELDMLKEKVLTLGTMVETAPSLQVERSRLTALPPGAQNAPT